MAWSGYSEQGAGSQERGPGRFALQVPGAPQRRAMPTPDAVQGGVRGGQITGGISVGRDDLNISSPGASPELRPDPTFNALIKMGGQFFADKVKDLEEQVSDLPVESTPLSAQAESGAEEDNGE